MRWSFAIFAFLFLMGCAEKTPPVEPAPPPEPVIEIIAEEAVIEEPPKPRFMVENMLNLAPGTVRNILGEATLMRAEKDVRVWMYRNSICVLQLYFYPDDHGDFRLDYVDAQAGSLSADDCLDSHIIQRPSYPEKNRDLQPDRSDN